MVLKLNSFSLILPRSSYFPKCLGKYNRETQLNSQLPQMNRQQPDEDLYGFQPISRGIGPPALKEDKPFCFLRNQALQQNPREPQMKLMPMSPRVHTASLPGKFWWTSCIGSAELDLFFWPLILADTSLPPKYSFFSTECRNTFIHSLFQISTESNFDPFPDSLQGISLFKIKKV